MPVTVTMQDLQHLQPNCHIIDIRTPAEFAKGHFPNSINIPYEVLMMYPESYLNQIDYYYLICEHGSVSYRACAILSKYGYNVATVKHGYDVRFSRY